MTTKTLVDFIGTLSLTESYAFFVALAATELGDLKPLNKIFETADDLKKSAILNVLFIARAEGVNMSTLANIAQDEVFVSD